MNGQEIYYVHEESVHNTKAAEAFLPYLLEIIKPKSVLDVGCGIGTWLYVLNGAGAERILGIDGTYVDVNHLHIASSNFITADLRKKISLHERFDLVISLEVAEHLPITSTDDFIDTLTEHGDVILFSAALPKQRGQYHVNEQRFEYWVQHFNVRGYVVLDMFRNDIWENLQIDWWYRQNMFLVVKSDHALAQNLGQSKIHDFYHPELFLIISSERDALESFCKKTAIEHQLLSENQRLLMNGEMGITISLKIFIKALAKRASNIFNRL